jgi:uncharacterized membrane protein
MPPDPGLLALLLALALGAYATRIGGYLAARVLGLGPRGVRVVRLTTGNLLCAVGAVGVAQLGWPGLAAAGATVAAMAATGREWLALPLGAGVAALAAAVVV